MDKFPQVEGVDSREVKFNDYLLVDLSNDLAVDLKNVVKTEGSFGRFAASFAVDVKAGAAIKEQLLKNEGLKEEFLAIESQDLSLQRGKDYREKIADFARKVEEAVPASQFSVAYGRHIFLERRRRVLGKILDTVDPQTGEIFVKDIKNLNLKAQNKEISQEEYYLRLDEVYDKAILNSDDVELKEKWLKYQAEEEGYSFVVDKDRGVSPSENVEEKPLADKKDVDLAVSDVRDLGIKVDILDDSAAKVHFPNFSVDVSVFKNERTNELVYYLNDKFAEKSVPVKKEDFLKALDQRHLDMFLSDKIGLNLPAPDSILEISDEKLIALGEKLIGKGEKRSYRIEGENREILEGIARILVKPDRKYFTLVKKIDVLNDFLTTDDRLFAVKKRLVNANSVQELMGDL